MCPKPADMRRIQAPKGVEGPKSPSSAPYQGQKEAVLRPKGGEKLPLRGQTGGKVPFGV